MNKIRFISLTASLVFAITFILSCEDKETKDKPAAVVAVPETAGAASPPETVAAGSESVSKIMYVNDKKGLNMRSEPSTDGVKLGTLPYGEKIRVLEKSSTPMKIGEITDYWYKTDTNVTLGGKVYKHSWVFGGFLSENPPKDRVRVIDKTCLIFIPNYEYEKSKRERPAADEFEDTGDDGFYRGNAIGQFRSLGIESFIDIGVEEKERYLSFVLDNGERHVIDLKDGKYREGLLYKKGKKPVEVGIGWENPVEQALEAISTCLGMEASEVMRRVNQRD
jgi:hypothetical protein